MIFLGLDLATRTSGWSVLDQDMNIIDKGTFYADGDDVRERIGNIYFEVNKLVDKYNPDILVLEDVPINPWVNIKIGKDLSILHGSILAIAFQRKLKYLTYAPTEWRSQAGTYDGTRAGMKREAQKAKAIQLVKEIYNMNIDSDDIAEAILISRVGVVNFGGQNECSNNGI